MINDPIVEEVYQARQKILQKWGGDLNKWLDHLRDANRQHADRVVTLEMVRQKSSSRPAGEELVAYWNREGLVGTRPEITDPAAHSRSLRERAEKRNRS